MNDRQLIKTFGVEVSSRVLCSTYDSAREIQINGLTLRPDRYTSFVEFNLAHAYPVLTVDGIGMHPQVVANSYAGLRWKVFNIGHMIRSYDAEENARDRIIGTIIGVEFPEAPLGGWKVGSSRATAPGIRAVAAMHKQAEGVDRIIGQHQSGRRRWTVSRESDWYLKDAGFLVRCAGRAGECGLEEFEARTPKDLLAHGQVYVPAPEAPDTLLRCYVVGESKVRRQWQGAEVSLLVGGLNESVEFKGTGLTPLGKEAEAEVEQMLASGVGEEDLEAALAGGGGVDLDEALRNFQKNLETACRHLGSL